MFLDISREETHKRDSKNMRQRINYKKIPLSITRKMVIASIASNKKNAIHCLTKIDITKPRELRNEIFQKTNKKISFNAYILRCFAEAIKNFPEMNSFIRSNKLIVLEDINISLMVERVIDGVNVPEPLCIKNTDRKSLLEIHHEIRSAQSNNQNKIGSLSNVSWINIIPGFLFRLFIKIAERSIRMADKYGKIAVSSPGMYSNTPSWFIPHGTATVFLVIGNIRTELYLDNDSKMKQREMLNITLSFDHEIIDGAPAARFVTHFEKVLSRGELMKI
jgi:pyruvate/2-oxoglutarate dehydrogenase complex dihydrolipoamide acyltransferase (E2) component